MIKKLVLMAMAMAMVISGCATVTVKKVEGDKTCEASYASMLKSTTGISMSACDAEGKADTSKVDPVVSALIEALRGDR